MGGTAATFSREDARQKRGGDRSRRPRALGHGRGSSTVHQRVPDMTWERSYLYGEESALIGQVESRSYHRIQSQGVNGSGQALHRL